MEVIKVRHIQVIKYLTTFPKVTSNMGQRGMEEAVLIKTLRRELEAAGVEVRPAGMYL
jgi:hypothetical protein